MANTTVADLLPSSALVGSEKFYADNGTQDVFVTSQQIKNYAVQVPFTIGANVSLLTTGLFVGNATANLNINSVSLVVGNTTVNGVALASGNSTANLVANGSLLKVTNSTSSANLYPNRLVIGNSIVNTTSIWVGDNVGITTITITLGNTSTNLVANSKSIFLSNVTSNVQINTASINVGANVSISLSTFRAGNTTANLLANGTMTRMSNATGSANLQPTQLLIGNATSYAQIGGAGVPCAIVGSNTFNCGANSATANGYTYLFNGFLLQWGWVAANTSVGNILFPVAFPGAIYSWQATANSAAAGAAYVIASNTTTMNVRTASTAAASNTWWMAIGR